LIRLRLSQPSRHPPPQTLPLHPSFRRSQSESGATQPGRGPSQQGNQPPMDADERR
jgi:hypothetical protein